MSVLVLIINEKTYSPRLGGLFIEATKCLDLVLQKERNVLDFTNSLFFRIGKASGFAI
jgi:hypothetical protein